MKYLILGAGPAGLSFANCIYKEKEDSFLLLEAEQEAGGLCRSTEVDGAPFDIGGGHFLDVTRPEVNQFLFEFMPKEEWNRYSRNSQIAINGIRISSPIEANIWQMKLEDQIQYLKSAAIAGCNLEIPMPEKFVDWIEWKLGKKIAADYMLPYNQKMFADGLDELGTYWLNKLPDVSFEETLLSCLTHKACGTQPGHAEFYYPKNYGYGEVWRRMAEEIKDHIVYKAHVKGIDFNTKTVLTKDGKKYNADRIINTIPWAEFEEINGMPYAGKVNLKKLKYSSIETRYFPEKMETDAHWIYYPDRDLPYHRILVRHNFCPNSRGYWTETRTERVSLFGEDTKQSFHYQNKYAYPLNTIGKPEIMYQLLKWCESKEVYGLGRWGEHQHYNSDVTVELALRLARRLCG